MPPGRGLRPGAGAWTPSLSGPGGTPMAPAGGRDGRLCKFGPTNADVEVKDALQRMLKPVNYSIIVPWMELAGEHGKKDVIVLSRCLASAEAEHADQRSGFAAATEPLLANSNGRVRVAKAVPVSADRIQQDMLRSKHGADQRDRNLKATRHFFGSQYASIPSVDTVHDAHRLGEINLAKDPTTRVLTEEARRRLQLWQVRGPERDRQAAAQVMRALRSISEAVTALPTYQDHCRSRGTDGGIGGGVTGRMHEYSQLVGKGHKIFKAGMVPGQLRASRSAPLLMRTAPPYLSAEEIDNIRKRGGDVVNNLDATQLAMLKNRCRASRSKIATSGGNVDWTTSFGLMASPAI
mmetsp:Transcript_84760/g.230095  ORF Transcript_84760/g.230095 Transcript_84760/m.230095 type:complete len:350 (+) Transcript_84760:119-1168(+)